MAWYEEPRILLSGLAFIVLTPILIVLIVHSDKTERTRKNRPPEEDYIDLRFEGYIFHAYQSILKHDNTVSLGNEFDNIYSIGTGTFV